MIDKTTTWLDPSKCVYKVILKRSFLNYIFKYIIMLAYYWDIIQLMPYDVTDHTFMQRGTRLW